MAPHRRNAQSSEGDAPDIARAIEAMVAAMAQQSTAMIQQHEASMQRQDAHRQHMDFLYVISCNRLSNCFLETF